MVMLICNSTVTLRRWTYKRKKGLAGPLGSVRPHSIEIKSINRIIQPSAPQLQQPQQQVPQSQQL